MSKTLNFVRLDFFTIKPYLTIKNLIIFIFVAFIMGLSTGDSSATIGIFAGCGSIYVSYPFAVGEQNGIDTLYFTMPIHRKNIVMGRYLFAICFNIFACVLAYVVTFATFTIFGKAFASKDALAVLAVMFFIFSFIQLIQLPLFFRLGYAKAKILAYIPFLCIPLIIFMLGTLLKDADASINTFITWVSVNSFIMLTLCVIAWFLALIVSYKLSLKFYGERDF